ncbi:hypothetical protein ACFWUW_13185 [Streptomyces sp. NPDC058655]|uniref:hypothetical protein n=1 Tax=unclassified Streptomyces TaxID=2593676 RepID=UPI00364D3741
MGSTKRLARAIAAVALTGLTFASTGTASALPAQAGARASHVQVAPLADPGLTGTLQAGKWKKVLWGWGWYDIAYAASISSAGGKVDCYTTPNPWPRTYRTPATVWFSVKGYGDCWLYSPVNATYSLRPVTY